MHKNSFAKLHEVTQKAIEFDSQGSEPFERGAEAEEYCELYEATLAAVYVDNKLKPYFNYLVIGIKKNLPELQFMKYINDNQDEPLKFYIGVSPNAEVNEYDEFGPSSSCLLEAHKEGWHLYKVKIFKHSRRNYVKNYESALALEAFYMAYGEEMEKTEWSGRSWGVFNKRMERSNRFFCLSKEARGMAVDLGMFDNNEIVCTVPNCDLTHNRKNTYPYCKKLHIRPEQVRKLDFEEKEGQVKKVKVFLVPDDYDYSMDVSDVDDDENQLAD